MKADLLNDEQKALVCFAINQFGDGQHPVASACTLKYFTAEYAAKCMSNLVNQAAEVVKPGYHQTMREALRIVQAA